MSRYADVEWLKTEFDEANEICFFYLNADTRGAFEELKKIVEQAPSIDICFCRECKYGEYREDHDDYLCRDDGICVHDADWFCADGERNSSEKPNKSEIPTGSERSSE